MSLSLNRGRFKENSTSTQMRMHSSARSPPDKVKRLQAENRFTALPIPL
ncbi:hypothetical protein SS05631_c30710 [Sinorhizobium sp. CCBAU 05631]|nr:hypothetical protein SS05631_c30710 [Sinorhizobium sp. CCBAU 05631]